MLSPLPTAKWTEETAAHLLNRAGFGGTPAEIKAFATAPQATAVDRLLAFEEVKSLPTCATADADRAERIKKAASLSGPEKQKLRQEEQRRQRELLVELRQWWLQRMLTAPNAFQEKLTLFWHGHFATSAQKVRDAHLMWRQNQLFRTEGLGTWRTLLTKVSQDPAMLVWLDQAQSRKQSPNENYARELMELFTLGEGNYTEKDVTEAARALTGWSYDRLHQRFANRPALHDREPKTIFGKTGNWDGHDVIRLILEKPQASRFITAKLWSFFAGEAPEPSLNDALAATFRASGHEFKPLLRTMLLSEEFYASKLIRNQVKSPVQWLVGSANLLERGLPPTPMTQGVLRTLGQDLLLPPNVKGWDGGLSWITTSNLLTRNNFAAFLVTGANPLAKAPGGKGKKGRRSMGFSGGADVAKLFTPEELKDKIKLLAALEKRFIQARLREKQRQLIHDYLNAQGQLDQQDVLHAMRLIMSTPDYQLA
ncbi:MAG TPA: DUF1800 domain-containing protein [Methylomirabilota bacterium]|nr:DUF1800 domain-containing protein [Methylomirabilota bacterium]